jgi:O-antigen/teichoic acid export membrane protein
MPDGGSVPPPSDTEFDLSGTGRHFLWSILPTIASLLASIFVISYSIRKLGARDYGAVVTITSAVMVLTVFSGAIRYAVVRSGARFNSLASRNSATTSNEEMDVVRAAHTMFIGAAATIILVAAGLGWLIPVDLHLRGSSALQVYVATIIFVGSSSVAFALTAYAGVLTGEEQFGWLSQTALAGLVVQVIGSILLVGRLHIIGLALASLASTIVQQGAIFILARRRVPWLSLFPRRPNRSVALGVLRYSVGIAILSATSAICSASDAFVIGAINGGAAVTIFRVGATAPTSAASLLYSAFGVSFPRLARTDKQLEQVEAVGWLGKIVGWFTGAAYASLCLVAADFARLLLGRSDFQATEILWISAAALTVDVSFHGVVQVIFAQGQQGRLAKYSWIELTFNLAVTYFFVRWDGPVGSAWALAGTIVLTDMIGFPLLMRGRYGGSNAGVFVFTHGVYQSVLAGALALAIGTPPVLVTHGLGVHLAIAVTDVVIVSGVGIALLRTPSRRRLRNLIRPNTSRSVPESG